MKKKYNVGLLLEIILISTVLLNVPPILFGFITHMCDGWTFWTGFKLCYLIYGLIILFTIIYTFTVLFIKIRKYRKTGNIDDLK